MAGGGPAFRAPGSLGECHKTPIVPFPRSHRSLKTLHSLGSSAGEFILTSGSCPVWAPVLVLSVTSLSAMCVADFYAVCHPDLFTGSSSDLLKNPEGIHAYLGKMRTCFSSFVYQNYLVRCYEVFFASAFLHHVMGY